LTRQEASSQQILSSFFPSILLDALAGQQLGSTA
jgi:hypothetical protein